MINIDNLLKKFNDLYPDLIVKPETLEWAPSEKIRKNSNKDNLYPYVDMKCKICGHEWRANLISYTTGRVLGCTPCKLRQGAPKRLNTMLERYGTVNTHKEDFAEKCKKTCLERYGVDSYSKTKEFEERRKATNLEKYGIEYVFHTEEALEKSKQTKIERYGVAHMLQTEEGRAHTRQTCLERYGVENPMQCSSISKNHCRKYVYQNIQFDSSWELAFYIYHEDKNILLEREPETDIWYEDVEGKKHRYYPDFKLGDKLIEVKADPWWKRGDDNYREVVTKEASVIGQKEIQPYINYCREKFGSRKWYEQFRRSKKVVGR